MKFSAERETILAPLQAVIGVVERRQTMPILANVLVAGRGGKLSITATDLEVELVAKTEVTCSRRAKSRCPDASCSTSSGVAGRREITMSLEGERMTVRAGKSRFTLTTLAGYRLPDRRGHQRAADAEDAASRTLQAAARQDAFLDGAAGRALLPQRHVAGNVG